MSVSFSDIWAHVKKNGISPIEDVANLIIRPPRATYSLAALGPPVFRIQTTDTGKPCATAFKRHDFTLTSMRGLSIECSWYRPYVPAPASPPPPPPPPANNTNDDDDDDGDSSRGAASSAAAAAPRTPANSGEKPRPCVVYLHGNSGCRLDGQEILFIMERGITVMTYDACGSGNSGGEHVSLGIYERTDLAIVLDHLRSTGLVTTLGLWGRSMGAVTSLMYAARDPTAVKCIVLDSPFSTLRLLIADLVEQHAQWAPTFAIDAIVDKVRRRIVKNAGFDINDLDALDAARRCTTPCFIFHGKDDTFVRPQHSLWIANEYKGSCLRHEVAGGHNDERMADARDVALQLLYLYLVEKPAAEQEPQRRMMLEQLEQHREQMHAEEQQHLLKMKQLHDSLEKEDKADADADDAAAAAAAAAAAKASPLFDNTQGASKVTHVRARESLQDAKAREAGSLSLDEALKDSIHEAFAF